MTSKKKSKKYPPEPQQTRVHVVFLQDKSGSMAGTWPDTCGGYTGFVNSLKEKGDGVEYIFSLILFDMVVYSILNGIPIQDVNSKELSKYHANGGTALYDALGTAITDAKPEVDKVIYIIVTDGMETSSRTWNKTSLHSLVDSKLHDGKSTFQYLGSQPETWNDAFKVGLSAGQTVSYDPSNFRDTYAVVADSINSFSSSNLASTKSLIGSFADKNLVRTANMTVRKDNK